MHAFILLAYQTLNCLLEYIIQARQQKSISCPFLFNLVSSTTSPLQALLLVGRCRPICTRFLLATGKQREIDLSLYICSSMLYNYCSQQRWCTFIVLLAGVYRGYGTNSSQASSTSRSLSGHPTICALGLSAPRRPCPLKPISMVKVSQSPVDGGRGFYLWLFHF
jgi:hypothetical protein